MFRKNISQKENLLDEWLNSKSFYDKDKNSEHLEKYKYLSKNLSFVKVDVVIDLHCLTVKESFCVLENFMKDFSREDDLIVKIIHGKGNHSKNGPKLKYAVFEWLKNNKKNNFIKLYAIASNNNGGEGAVIIWISR